MWIKERDAAEYPWQRDAMVTSSKGVQRPSVPILFATADTLARSVNGAMRIDLRSSLLQIDSSSFRFSESVTYIYSHFTIHLLNSFDARIE